MTWARFARSWSRTVEAIYVYRTDKPHAVLGLPIIGRHFAYGGRTCDLEARHAEHMTGKSRRSNGAPQPWSNLRPKRYVVFGMRSRFEWWTAFLERLVIKGLFCVYNWQDRNRLNPRAIPPRKARVQRDTRDRTGGASKGVRLVWRWCIYAAVVGMIFWIYGGVTSNVR